MDEWSRGLVDCSLEQEEEIWTRWSNIGLDDYLGRDWTGHTTMVEILILKAASLRQ